MYERLVKDQKPKSERLMPASACQLPAASHVTCHSHSGVTAPVMEGYQGKAFHFFQEKLYATQEYPNTES